MAEHQFNELDNIRSENFQNIYSNIVRVGFTTWDISITFGTIEEMSGKQLPTVVDYAAVRMSPQHFKALLKVLHNTLVQYEDKYGPISSPKGVHD